MGRLSWATIHEITDNGFYAFRVVGGKYQLAKENFGVVNFEALAQMTGTNEKYLKQVFTMDFSALDCDVIMLSNKDDAEMARDWVDGLYFYKNAKAI